MKKYIYDILIISFILIGSLIAYFLINHSNGDDISKINTNVIISVNGDKLYEYPLFENRTVVVSTEFGMNEIIIDNGKVFVSEADCPDRLCVNYQPISKLNDSIYCLPNRLVIELLNNDLQGEYDSYVY